MCGVTPMSGWVPIREVFGIDGQAVMTGQMHFLLHKEQHESLKEHQYPISLI